jgi:hypothetical protein
MSIRNEVSLQLWRKSLVEQNFNVSLVHSLFRGQEDEIKSSASCKRITADFKSVWSETLVNQSTKDYRL